LIKAYRNNAAGLDAALQVIGDLPLEKRYTWRVFSALKWAFADFEDEYVALDLPHISEPTRSEMTKELELRLQQLRMLLQLSALNKLAVIRLPTSRFISRMSHRMHHEALGGV
jgi:hypothetical protein